MPSILGLPYDVLQHVFDELSGPDTLHLISSQKHLYSELIDDDHTWRRFCLPYGVADRKSFQDRSFRDIYGLFLHIYGPLLGLWCSDYPFRGNILQFRLLPDHQERDGEPVMVGDVWKFTFQPGQPSPHLPYYVEFVQIGFAPRTTQADSPANDVSITWHLRNEHESLSFLAQGGPWRRRFDGNALNNPSLHLIGPSDSTVQLRNYFAHPITNPEFPETPITPWYDSTRRTPHLPVQSPPPILLTPPRWYNRSPAELRYISGAPKPFSIAFSPESASESFADLHHPNHELSDRYAMLQPRYFPLRTVVEVGVDPASAAWSANSLGGLWLGDYGPHGTECLFIEYDEAAGEVRAWKITGDTNVPRGVWSWCATVTHDAPFTDVSGVTFRGFEAQGRFAQHGYV
ncbi:uncharacterized protein BXZ73DRAFT_48348 [Epithele typhae]|uniref:uncharacterized protein n=1 Tax=Epithele typhae TaxID=378194 RepID=UPI00200780DD|nr:uncharacterized protein BXZ73DRAFT_48348 [Epithele typhae]KAH9928502.1 hypothetical protein BXZ73DRAFT_48348 [Epithele typhae]